MDNDNFLKECTQLSICLQKAIYCEPNKYIYGVPIVKLKTKKHRIVSYYKSVSKMFHYE